MTVIFFISIISGEIHHPADFIVVNTLHGGGSVMVWAALGTEGTMNSTTCPKMLKENV